MLITVDLPKFTNILRVLVVGAAGAIGQVHLWSLIQLREAGVKIKIHVVVRDETERATLMSGKWAGLKHKNNLGVEFPDQINMKGVTAYKSLEEALADTVEFRVGELGEIGTLGIIATPTDTHLEIARQMIDAGVEVVAIEKPIAFDSAPALELIAYAQGKGTKILVLHELCRFAEWAALEKWLGEKSAKGCKPVSMRFTRVVSRNEQVADPAHAERFKSPVFDLKVHDIQWALRRLRDRKLKGIDSVANVAGITDFPLEATTTLWFEGGCTVVCHAGVRDGGFCHGFEVTTSDEETTTFNSDFAHAGVRVSSSAGRSKIEVASTDPFVDQMADVLKVAGDGADPGSLDAELGAQAVKVVNLAIEMGAQEAFACAAQKAAAAAMERVAAARAQLSGQAG